jgi:hypothetical protein
MTYVTFLRKLAASAGIFAAILLISGISFGQKHTVQSGPLRPNLGTASTYAIFTGGGAINVSTGDTAVLTGDVGQDGAYAFNGFPPSTYTGTLNRNNGASAIAKADLITAQTANGLVPCDIILGVGIVDGQSFNSAVYCSGAATTTTGNITFNAQGDANAIFIVKIGGQLDANSGTHILLANNARAANIYWFVNGAVNIANNSSFAGTIIANGAITFLGHSSLNGRALVAPAGAINLAGNRMSISTDSGSAANNLTVTRPASGDTIKGGMLTDTITWTGSGIARVKTIQYSLDSGLTWTTIATINNDSLRYLWHVPDTVSIKAFVRVTDSNNLRGMSGRFTIVSSKIIVVRPSLAEIITGGTQHYQITWTGSGLASVKTIALSLDSGLTWTTIATVNGNVFSSDWNVPDTASRKSYIRITDGNGLVGISGLFTILSSKLPAILVVRPAGKETILGGTQNYQITFTGYGIATQKTFDYSLDGGLTWHQIGTMNSDAFSFTWTSVPDTSSDKALVRITDKNGLVGTSGIFTIRSSKVPVIVVLRPEPGEVIVEGTMNYQISWTGTGLTPLKKIELSLNGGLTWTTVQSITTEAFTYNWNVPDTVSAQALIRITDGNGITGTSGLFSIVSSSPVLGQIVIIHPVTGEVVDGGYQNFPITFTASNTTMQKTLEYSIDGGANWILIGYLNSEALTFYWASVPNVNTTQALIRITDANGVRGISGLFTIEAKPGVGTINSVILSGLDNKRNIGNNQTLGISWTYTPEIGNSVEVEYSLDYMVTWNHIASVLVAESPDATTWITTPSGFYNPVFVRVTSSLGMSRIAAAFSIGSSASVASHSNGYSLSNYPNPTNGVTNISFELSTASSVTVSVTNSLGREVATVGPQQFGAGMNSMPLNLSELSEGVYHYTLHAGAVTLAGRMVVVK